MSSASLVSTSLRSLGQTESPPTIPFRWKIPLLVAIYYFFFQITINGVVPAIGVRYKRETFGGNKEAGVDMSYIGGVKAILGIPGTAIVGILADRLGRRPILILAAILCTAIPFSMWVAKPNAWPFIIIFFFLDTCLATGSIGSAMIADEFTDNQQRMKAQGIIAVGGIMGNFGSLVLLIPGVTNTIGLFTAMGCGVLMVIFTVALMPETRAGSRTGTSATAQKLRQSLPSTNPFRAIWSILKQPLMASIIITKALMGAASSGLSDIGNFYLKEHINYDERDRVIGSNISNVMGILTMMIILPLCVKKISCSGLVIISLLSQVAAAGLTCFAPAPWFIWGPVNAVGALSGFEGPAFGVLQAAQGVSGDQVMRQIVVSGVRGFIAGVWQFFFAPLYKDTSRYVPYIVSGAMLIIAIGVASQLFRWFPGKKKTGAEDEQDRLSDDQEEEEEADEDGQKGKNEEATIPHCTPGEDCEQPDEQTSLLAKSSHPRHHAGATLLLNDTATHLEKRVKKECEEQ